MLYHHKRDNDMTRKEIMLNTKWDEFDMGTCRIYVDLFDQYIPFILFQEHRPTPDVSQKMISAINSILGLKIQQEESLKSMLYENYLVQEKSKGNSKLLDREEVYLQSKIDEIHIDQENDRLKGIYSEVIVTTMATEPISLIVKDGDFICIDDGTYFDTQT
jgi:hypothetical protein